MKAYVLVRSDILSPEQITVQVAHALAELMLKPEAHLWAREHKTLVVLATSKGYKLEQAFSKLKTSNKAFFTEPDLNNQVTALAWLGENEPLGSKFQLLNFKKLANKENC